MHDCIFCKIVKGGIPSSRVFENDRVLAILDIRPLAPGHTLVLPKGHFPALPDMPPEEMAALGRVLPMIGKAVQAATGAEGFNVLQSNGEAAGQEVFHVHFHIVPRRKDDGLGYRWNAGSYTGDEMKSWLEKIRQHLPGGIS
ncbi:MAG: HIT family protein [Planctomycetota bacterium]